MEKYRVIFNPDGEKELSALIVDHPELKALAFRYVEDLIDFPPENWADIHWRHQGETFKSDNHVILDIQGFVHESSKTVVITRFRARRKS